MKEFVKFTINGYFDNDSKSKKTESEYTMIMPKQKIESVVKFTSGNCVVVTSENEKYFISEEDFNKLEKILCINV